MSAHIEPVIHHPFEGCQSRFVAYCREKGYESPFQQWAADRHNGPFMAWTTAKWKEWRAASGWTAVSFGPEQHAAFDAWLGSAA
jgi:hypothetical protein